MAFATIEVFQDSMVFRGEGMGLPKELKIKFV